MGIQEPTTTERGGATTSAPPPLPQSKEEVRARREELRAALVELEDVLSGPAGDHEHWGSHVRQAVERMEATLRSHVRETESEGGLLEQIDADAPWLDGRVEQLRSEHGDLLRRTEQLSAHCRRPDHEPTEVREEALALLQAVSRHRHQGTDLLYDAYMVDISAAD